MAICLLDFESQANTSLSFNSKLQSIVTMWSRVAIFEKNQILIITNENPKVARRSSVNPLPERSLARGGETGGSGNARYKLLKSGNLVSS